MNLHQDIKNVVLKCFDFLQNLGFSKFQEKQLAYEIHFSCHREKVKFNVCYELIYSTPIWITINGMDVTLIMSNNLIIQDIDNKKRIIYDSNKNENPKHSAEQYQAFGKELNDLFIQEVSKALKKKKSLLLGDLTEIEKAEKQRVIILEKEKKQYNKANGIYTCEYNWNGLICEHQGTLEEIEEHLAERKDMNLTEIVIFDWNGNKFNQKR